MKSARMLKNSRQIGIPDRILGADGFPGCIFCRIKQVQKSVMNDVSKNADKNSGQIRIPDRILGVDGLPEYICF